MEISNIKITSKKTFMILTIGALIWHILIILAPILKSTNLLFLNKLSEYFYFLFEPVCHQILERSILIDSEPMAVCSRCFSIYLGSLSILVYALLKKETFKINLYTVSAFCLPALIDFVFGKFGVYNDSEITRILTGLPLGAGIMFLILFSLSDIKNYKSTKWKVTHGKSEIN